MRGRAKTQIRLFQRQEMERILSHLPSRTLLPITIAVNLGLTGPEVLSLRWAWVDLVNGEIFVKWAPYDTGRYVLLPEALVRSLEAHKHVPPLVDKVCASHDGKTLLRIALSRDFKTACVQAGIPSGSFGDVRLSNAKWLLDAGIKPSIVAARLGMNRHTIQRHFKGTPTRSKDIQDGLDRDVLDSITVLPPEYQ